MMKFKMTIREALKMCEKEIKKISSPQKFHPNPTWIERFAEGADVSDLNKWIKHIADCHICRERWANYLKNKKTMDHYSDVVLLKVASSENKFEEPTSVYSESGRYMISFIRSLEDNDLCLVKLNVVSETDDLNQQTVIVRDNNHRILLSEQISQGEASNWIKNLDKIDISSISVIVQDSEE